MSIVDKLAESKIVAALERGELSDLPGRGKPMVLDDDAAVPPELKTAYRILKNSGYVPAEITLLAEIKRVEASLNQTGIKSERVELVAKLALLKSKLAN